MAVTNYIWDVVSDNLLMEKDESGNTIASYATKPDEFGELISQRRNGQAYYYHYDGEGNSRAVTDHNGNLVETATYSAFGEVVEKTSSIVNPFGYKEALGYYANPTTNDVAVRGRIYMAVIARWLSVDPIWFFVSDPGGRRAMLMQKMDSLYSYVSNNAINRVDPSGGWELGYPGLFPGTGMPVPAPSPPAQNAPRFRNPLPGMFCHRYGLGSRDFICFNWGCPNRPAVMHVTMNSGCSLWTILDCDTLAWIPIRPVHLNKRGRAGPFFSAGSRSCYR